MRALSKTLIASVTVVAVVWGVLNVADMFSPAAHGRKVATVLKIGDRGRVEVILGGEDSAQRAENGLRLYEGDRVRTDGGSSASLYFFDKSVVKLDVNTEVLLDSASVGSESAEIVFNVESGNVFVDTGTGVNVSRILKTAGAQYSIPPRTRAIVGDDLYVFAVSGQGVRAAIPISSRTSAFVVVGEGQQLIIDGVKIKKIKEEGMDPYKLRGVLDERILSSPFYLTAMREESGSVPGEIPETADVDVGVEKEGEMLTIEEPEDGSLLQGSAFLVRGSVGKRVVNVNVNGYPAELEGRKFVEEIAMPDEENFSVDITAEDRNGLIIAEKSISLSHDINPPDQPVITGPGGSGDVIQVDDNVFEIVGESSPDTTGIIVNGYQLQKYRPGGVWKYLVDPKLGNVSVGENSYEVVAIDRAGNKSDPATITIVWKAQPLPVFADGGGDRDASAYLAPDSLKVTAPTADNAKYVTEAEEVIIEGKTSPETFSISINGFTLTLYEPGKTTWNYVAKREFGNYRKGINKYTIVARNKEGRILDVVRYLIEKM